MLDEHTPLTGAPQPRVYKAPSINIMVLTVLLQSIGFTVVMPSLNFYLEYVAPSSSEKYPWLLGVTVGAYSLGQFLGSPVFGYWSNHRPALEGLVVSVLFGVLGNLWYSSAYVLSAPVVHLIIARFITGFGAGNVSVCRAYVSHATDVHNRRSAMAKMSGAQGVGFVLGPMIGMVFGLITPQHFSSLPSYFGPLDYTLVGWASCLINAANLVLLLWYFVEIPIHPPEPQSERSTKRELVSIFASIFIFMCIIANFAVFETIVTRYTLRFYGWKVVPNGMLLGGAGVVSILTYIVISLPLVKKLGDRSLLAIGLGLLIISLLGLARWPGVEKGMPKVQFYIACVLQAVGYPIASALLYSIFSKVLNPRGQGGKMGWLTAGGSLARMLSPIWATSAWHKGHSTLLFFGTAGIVTVSLIVELAFWRFLVPHPDTPL